MRRSLSFLSFVLVVFFLAWFVQTLTTASLPNSKRPIIFYANQLRDDFKLTFAQAIGQAKKSVTLIVYSLSDREMIEALRRQAKKGCHVRLICDAQASKGIQVKLGPDVKVFARSLYGLMHQKILVIDGKKTWIGSANFTTESLKMHGNLVIGFEDVDLAAIAEAKADALSQIGKREFFSPKKMEIGGQRVELRFLPDDSDAVDQMIAYLKAAKKTIQIAMFTWTRDDFAQAVINAARRGVNVKVVMDHHSARGASAKIVKLFEEAKVPVALSQGSALLHHKFAIIDEETFIQGSANWTESAFSRNDDCFLVLKDLTDQQKTKLRVLWLVICLESTLNS